MKNQLTLNYTQRQTRTNDTFKVCEISLTYSPTYKTSELPQVTSSEELATVFRQFYKQETIQLYEEMFLILFNRENRVIGISNVSKGGIAGTVADPKIIFMTALKSACVSFAICHNHPSNNLKPSRADEVLTKKLYEGARLLDLDLIDHIIITSENHFSFADNGLLK